MNAQLPDEDENDEHDEREEGPAPKGDLASEKQLSFVRVLQEKMSLSDPDLAEILEEVAGVKELAELGRREASEVIDELQIRAKEMGVDLDAQPKASDKQVGFMRSLKRRAHLTDEEFAAFLEEHAGVREPEEVGKRDASVIIDQLLKRAEGEKGGAGGAKGGAAPKSAAKKPAAGGEKPLGEKKKPKPRRQEEDDAPPPADDDVPF